MFQWSFNISMTRFPKLQQIKSLEERIMGPIFSRVTKNFGCLNWLPERSCVFQKVSSLQAWLLLLHFDTKPAKLSSYLFCLNFSQDYENLWSISPIETCGQCFGASRNLGSLPSLGCLVMLLELTHHPPQLWLCFSRLSRTTTAVKCI